MSDMSYEMKRTNDLPNDDKTSENYEEKNKLKDEKEYCPSPVSRFGMTKKKHKEINNLIHIYSHKVNFDVSPLKRSTTNTRNSNTLPTIHKRTFINSSYSEDKKRKVKPKGSSQGHPKFSLEEEKAKIQKLKELIQQNKEKKLKEAKDMKDANRLMRENIMIFKEKLKEENKQKKRIVDAKYNILRDSIENYKIIKKECIDNLFNEEIEKEMKQIQFKEHELAYLRYRHENKKIKNQNNKITQSQSLGKTSSILLNGNNKNNSVLNADIKKLYPSKNPRGQLFVTEGSLN